MGFFNRVTIRTRLAIGFGLCVAATATMAIIGVSSFHSVRGSVDDLSAQIDSKVGSYQEQVNRLANYQRIRGLTDAERDIENLASLVPSIPQLPASATPAEQRTNELLHEMLTSKSDILTEERRLSEGRREVLNRLNELRNRVTEVVDIVRFETAIGIEETIARIQGTTATKSSLTLDQSAVANAASTKAFDQIKRVSRFQLDTQALLIQVYELTTTSDEARRKYAAGQIDDAVEKLQSEIQPLSEIGDATDLSSALSAAVQEIERIRGLNSDSERLAARERATKSVEKVRLECVNLVDIAQFEAVLAIEDALTGLRSNVSDAGTSVRQNVEALGHQTALAFENLVSALGVRAETARVENQLRTLLEYDSAEKLRTESSQLLDFAGRTQELIESIVGVTEADALLSRLGPLRELVSSIVEDRVALLELRNDEYEGRIVAALDTQLGQLSTASVTAANQIQNYARQEFEAASSTMRSRATIMTALGIGIFVLVAMIGFLVTTAIVRPLVNAQAILKDIAQGEGDLTKKWDVEGHDEIATLAGYFNEFCGKLRVVVKGVGVMTEQLTRSSGRLIQRANSMSQNAESLFEVIRTADTEKSEVSSAMAQVEGATTELEESIEQITSNVTRATEVSSTAQSNSADASRTVNQLAGSVEEIGQIIGLIQSVAEQTNLLSLNATIEAARAGDAGKGFAVVASEVKALATETNSSAESIQRIVTSIQAESASTVGAIQNVGEIVGELNENQSTISGAVSTQTRATSTVSTSVRAASSGVSNLATSFERMSATAGETASGAKESLEAAEVVSKASGELSKLMAAFKT